MASMRAIRPGLFQDSFIGSLSYLYRWLWIGLFAAVADDQGRFWANPLRIRADLFAFDRDLEVTDEDIRRGLDTFISAGKMVEFDHDGKKVCQFVNWWDHQNPRWAGPSNFPPPPDKEGICWKDRIRHHAGNGGGIEKINWKTDGGYTGGSEALEGELEY